MASIEEVLQTWDGEFVVTAYDPPSAAWIFIAVHDRTLGMATGGCRLSYYSTPGDGLRDAQRLARGMTYKWAAIDFPFGGGKTVLAAAKPLNETAREALLLRLGSIIDALGGAYGVGVDLGTSPADMATIGRRTRWVFGKPVEQGGPGDPGPWTAMGVNEGIRCAVEHAFGSDSLEGRTVLVQGLGGVGGPLTRLLAGGGATVLVSDAMPGRAQAFAEELGATVVAPEDTYRTPCDVFAPCAIGGILNERSIPNLQCRVVAGSANNQLERESDAELLHERGILYAPDFVINAGGAIAHGGLEVLGWTESRVRERVARIRVTLGGVFAEASVRGESPLREANRRAIRTLEAARAEKAPAG